MCHQHVSIICVLILLSIFTGCSSGVNPINTSLDQQPIIAQAGDIQSGTAMLGAYSVALNTTTFDCEMTPLRSSTISESNMINGMSFFTWFPCTNCFSVDGVRGEPGEIMIDFYIQHPMFPGDPSFPPSGTNRLDLDVFDLALVIKPSSTPQYYPLLNQNVMADICMFTSGYTSELSNVFSTPANVALPYYLVVDDNGTGTLTYNKFPMGQNTHCATSFKYSTTMLYFDVYLTMGYGASATFWTRLTPKYYNPEFNRKAAWKVSVSALGAWQHDQTTPVNVRVEVWDWQQGATVCPGNLADAPTDQIFIQSDVNIVQIEIPGMAPYPFGTNVYDSGTGSYNDPLVYTIPVYNDNLLPDGTYIGLVKVSDTRSPESANINSPWDTMISSSDGKMLSKHLMPEYATFQTFTAIVE
jgi:hypothetical protein